MLWTRLFVRVDIRTCERRYLQCYQSNKIAEVTTHTLVKHCETCTHVFRGQIINCGL